MGFVENMKPIGRVLLLAAVALFFAPRFIERTDTTCEAVQNQVVTMMMTRVTDADMAQMIAKVPGDPPEEVARDFVQVELRHTLERKVAPKLALADRPWYYCSVLYWVNFANPLAP